MKKRTLGFLMLISPVLTLNAQTWNGTNPLWTLSNVGIGTSRNDASLSVYGISNLFPHAANGGDIRSLSVNYLTKDATFISNDYPVVLTTGGGDQPLILDAARIGIGTTTPGAKLDVKGAVHFVGAYNLTLAAGEGTYINWNQTGGKGETDFINQQGGGTGGFAFYNTNNTAPGSILMFLNGDGNLGIGTSNPQYKLDVIGGVRAREVKVDLNGADFVFEKDYKLMSLTKLEKFVKDNKHLPDVASAKEMQENGAELGDLNSKLLQKIEEMTLYMIKQDKRIRILEKKIEALSK